MAMLLCQMKATEKYFQYVVIPFTTNRVQLRVNAEKNCRATSFLGSSPTRLPGRMGRVKMTERILETRFIVGTPKFWTYDGCPANRVWPEN